jgi:multicomponent Na+:H+ antiporter subunit A
VGISLAERGRASTLIFASGNDAPGAIPTLDWESLARAEGTLVFYVGIDALGPITATLTALGRDARQPALVVAGLLVIAAGIVASVDDRVAAIAALGAVGFLVAAWYVLYGAPQLAAVQLVVDGLTIALAVFILRHLPRRYPHVPRFERAGAACLALAGGAVVVLFSLLTRDVALPPASVAYFEEAWALRAANVVNAILAEFRGLDTVGETAVVGIAALGVAAVLKRRSAR